MKIKTSLTKTELEIMQYIWSVDSEVTPSDIRIHFSDKNWSKQAVSVFLKKLVKAHFLKVRRESVTKFYYSAALTEQEYSVLPAKEVLQDVFNNSISNFVLGLIPQNVTENDIRELENLLSELTSKQKQNDSITPPE